MLDRIGPIYLAVRRKIQRNGTQLMETATSSWRKSFICAFATRHIPVNSLSVTSTNCQKSFRGVTKERLRQQAALMLSWALVRISAQYCSCEVNDRYFHFENDSAVSGFPNPYASGRRTYGACQSTGSAERKLARRNEDHDEEHGRSALARRQLGP